MTNPTVKTVVTSYTYADGTSVSRTSTREVGISKSTIERGKGFTDAHNGFTADDRELKFYAALTLEFKGKVPNKVASEPKRVTTARQLKLDRLYRDLAKLHKRVTRDVVEHALKTWEPLRQMGAEAA